MDIPFSNESEENGVELGSCISSFVDKGSVESRRYYLARRTLLEMLRDRGYAVPDSEIDLPLHQFRTNYTETPDLDRLRVSTHLRSDPSKTIMAIFCGPGAVKINTLKGIATQVFNTDSLSGLILIVENRMTSQATKAMDQLPCKVETFQITDLLVNITKHVLKPNHKILTDREKKKLLEEFKIEEKQLPRMLLKDAIARYYGLVKGQVMKVTYGGELTGSHVTYRCVW